MKKIIGLLDRDNTWLPILEKQLGSDNYYFIQWDTESACIEAILYRKHHLLFIGPGFSYSEIGRRIRLSGIHLPILVVSPDASEIDCVLAFEIGIDDIVHSDKRKREIIARVRRLLRLYERIVSMANDYSGDIFDAGELKIFPESYKITINNRSKELNHNEMKILVYMFRRRGNILTRKELIKLLAGTSEERVIDSYISNLRSKIEKDRSHPLYIKTITRVGYIFDIPSVIE
ncbi:winged helix-turn-helix domain-containing protein [Alteribacillus sp. HJP-4]|uniref:response regulator transcription factor n=1 Tax=Alteribacillus sp. HJP-4 TaxID=2775394 RepID=UPI0035CD2956